jgi:hypothetical protein
MVFFAVGEKRLSCKAQHRDGATFAGAQALPARRIKIDSPGRFGSGLLPHFVEISSAAALDQAR